MPAPRATHVPSGTSEGLEASETVASAGEESAGPDEPVLVSLTPSAVGAPAQLLEAPDASALGIVELPEQTGDDAVEVGGEQESSMAGSPSMGSTNEQQQQHTEPGTPREVEEDESGQEGTDTPEQVCGEASCGI